MERETLPEALRRPRIMIYLRRMLRLRLPVVSSLLAAVLISSVAAQAADEDKIRVLKDTPISSSSDIPDGVRDQCREIGREIPRAIVRATRVVTLVNTEKELTVKRGKYLTIEVTQVRAKGGGMFSGPKHMAVRGVLFDAGKQIGDFEGTRSAMGLRSTCSNLENVEKVLGKEIARWLTDPRPNSRL